MCQERIDATCIYVAFSAIFCANRRINHCMSNVLQPKGGFTASTMHQCNEPLKSDENGNGFLPLVFTKISCRQGFFK